jgi:hypothetical protein
VFFENPENVSGRLGKSQIREKKCSFPVFRTTQIQPISGKSGKNFRENRTFSENFPKIPKSENSEIPENFGKKNAKTSILEFNPRLQRVLKRTFWS